LIWFYLLTLLAFVFANQTIHQLSHRSTVASINCCYANKAFVTQNQQPTAKLLTTLLLLSQLQHQIG